MIETQIQPNIPIIYEDDDLLVINKPAGILSQKDHTGDPDVLSLCKKYVSRSQNGSTYLGLVHRLDRPVGGLMLLAKNRPAAKKLARKMRNRTMQKTYWAVTSGSPPPNGLLKHYLLKNRNTNVVEVVSGKQKKGKEAILSFAKLETSDELNLLSIHLQTGRPHQIRVQLAHEGYPIWGDYKYGEDQPDGRSMALRAMELGLLHPKTEQELHLALTPPSEHPWTQFSIAHQ